MNLGARIARAAALQLAVTATIGSLYGAAFRMTSPGWLVIGARLTAAAALAGCAVYLAWWTRNRNTEDHPPVGTALRVASWTIIVGLAAVSIVVDQHAGVLTGGFVLYLATRTWPEILTRTGQALRRVAQRSADVSTPAPIVVRHHRRH